jgi:D-alanyl-D-alanine carboxypeptidase/D-alanyl-D-alanine-endopeptidase (penicillin-binding protein 4)
VTSAPEAGAARAAGVPWWRRTLPVLAGVLVVVTVLAGLALWRPGPVRAWLAGPAPIPDASPSPEPPPPQVLPAGAAAGPAPTADGVRAVIEDLVRESGLGERLNVSVVDVATGAELYRRRPETPTVPASTMKLATAAAVLAARGPAYQLVTRAVAGERPGHVILVGGGDPTLAVDDTGAYPGAARLDRLADQVRAALGDTPVTRVGVDSRRFTGDRHGPWDADIPGGGYVGPITALMTDGGRVDPSDVDMPARRSAEPDLAAGRAFAELLGLGDDADVARDRAPRAAPAAGTPPPAAGTPPPAAAAAGTPPATATPAPAAPVVPGAELGRVSSPPLVRLVELMLDRSDNVIAEALARQVALAAGEPASFAGAADAMRDVLADLGLPVAGVEFADGSGLSRGNRLTPRLLTELLLLAAGTDRPDLHGIYSGLPVAGWSGTLAERYRTPAPGEPESGSDDPTLEPAAGAGMVRAKTGTLYQVNALAGVVVTEEGRLLAFALLADQVPIDQESAQEALDGVAVALAGCGCR